MSYYLAVVSPLDSPLYEAQFATSKQAAIAGASSTGGFPSWSSLTGGGAGNASPSASTHSQAQQAARGRRGEPLSSSLLSGPSSPGVQGRTAQGSGAGSSGNGQRHVLQMIAHSSLDVVEDYMTNNGNLWVSLQ